MHRQDIGTAEQFVLLDPLDALRGRFLGRQILAPGDCLHAESEADPGDAAAEPAETQEAQRLAGEAMADPRLPTALAHEGVVLGDAAGGAEGPGPGAVGGGFVDASPDPRGAVRGGARLRYQLVRR